MSDFACVSFQRERVNSNHAEQKGDRRDYEKEDDPQENF